MFTSRAEYRILLRQDNADLRLTEKSHAIGLASDERLKQVLHKKEETEKLIQFIKSTSISPDEINPTLAEKNSSPLKQKVKMDGVLSRPGLVLEDFILASTKLREYVEKIDSNVRAIKEQAEVQIKYRGYLDREQEVADKLTRLEYVKITDDIDYSKFSSLSNESKEKLNKIRPETLGQASRISGIKPSEISILMIYLGR